MARQQFGLKFDSECLEGPEGEDQGCTSLIGTEAARGHHTKILCENMPQLIMTLLKAKGEMMGY